MRRPALPYTQSVTAQSHPSSSKGSVSWMCTVTGFVRETGGMKVYSVTARKTPFHSPEGGVPDLHIPNLLGRDRLPDGSVIFCQRIYRTVNGELVQYFVPMENPYLL